MKIKEGTVLATLSVSSYEDMLLPLEEAQKIQTIIAKHCLGTYQEPYNLRRNGAYTTVIKRFTKQPELRVRDDWCMSKAIDATSLTEKQYADWLDAHKDGAGDDAIMDPELWLNMRGE